MNRLCLRVLAGCAALAGAVPLTWSAPDASSRFPAPQRTHWAFQPVKASVVPTPQRTGWASGEIDAFILSKLEQRQIAPSPAADRRTWLRRTSFDLIGLAPTPEEMSSFLADQSPQAFEKVVDRLLASPHYGERWARHWLDLARYAESEGFKADETRPNAWRYRDYVIRSFNENKPYSQFVQEQIAGDELWPERPEARVATGFLRHYPDESNARNLTQRRQEILNDITDTVGASLLGLTVGCARCHDHKFDPILQADYYRLQAFFANTAADDQIPMLTGQALATYQARRAAWEEKTKSIRDSIATLLAARKAALRLDYFEKYPPEIQAIIDKPGEKRTPYEWQMYAKAKPYLEFDDETAAAALKGEQKTQYQALKAELARFAEDDPGPLPTGIGMKDLSAQAPPTFLLGGGAYDNPKDEVAPGFLTMLDPKAAVIAPVPSGTSGRRAALANWLVSADNPLTARVMVNRVWHYHFGQGLVGTPSDVGLMGQRPTHPELLDWLTQDFVTHGWDVKRLHRQIVLSQTYRQSSGFDAASAKADPRNRLLWRYPRQRLEGEVIRDSALQVAGLLNPGMGGASVYPELPNGMARPRGGWKVNAEAGERNRRSVYIFVRRNVRYPMLESFDMPDTHESCGRRNATVTAPQAMALLNGKVALEWAQAFAGRVLQSAGAEEGRQIETAFQLAYGRAPDASEKDTVQTFLVRQAKVLEQNPKRLMPAPLPASMDAPRAAAWVDLCHMLLNSNEFVYQN